MVVPLFIEGVIRDLYGVIVCNINSRGDSYSHKGRMWVSLDVLLQKDVLVSINKRELVFKWSNIVYGRKKRL